MKYDGEHAKYVVSISEQMCAKLQQNTAANELHGLYAIIQAGWPETKQQLPHSIQQYWDTRDELAVRWDNLPSNEDNHAWVDMWNTLELLSVNKEPGKHFTGLEWLLW